MSQITRCPSCATMFKVVADQLRISEGWVRCGHCQQVFDASAHLQPLQPPALMPDMALDQLRSPLQPVQRAPLPAAAWGTLDSRPAPAVEPQGDSSPLAFEQHGRAVEVDSASRTLEVPESMVPAFLAAGSAPAVPGRDMPDRSSAPYPSLVGEVPSEPPADQQTVKDWPTIEFTPALPPVEPSAGYELPAPVLDEGDGGGDPDSAGLETGVRESLLATLDPPVEAALQEEAEVLPTGQEEAAVIGVPIQADGTPDPQHLVPPDAVPDDHGPGEAQVAAAPHEQDVPPAPQAEIDPEAHDPAEAGAVAGELSFVRAARRKAFWRKTPVRISLLLLALALLCGLLLQVAVWERSFIAATWPVSRPYLEQLCAPLQCQVGPYRQIAAVVVDGSTFHKTRGEPYQFSLTLKNQSQTSVEMPAIELTLTDAQDQPVLR
ncbi:MAG: DUF3426 domain-containing protein, partial [Giesbergeria sp.]|nr:DUF3426 domain-containing protein [Giesbergeria sp.]